MGTEKQDLYIPKIMNIEKHLKRRIVHINIELWFKEVPFFKVAFSDVSGSEYKFGKIQTLWWWKSY